MKNAIKWILISIVTIIIIVIIAGIYKFNYLANQAGYDCDGNKIEKVDKSKVLLNKAKTINKELLYGSWIDLSNAKLDFSINRNGSAKSDNMESLLYKSWELNKNIITFTIESIGNHTSSTEKESYSIDSLTKNKMVLKDSAGVLYTYTKKK